MAGKVNIDGYQYTYTAGTETLILDKYTDSNNTVVVPTVEQATQYTLTINPTPSDATVTLTATGYSQVGNSITVESGTSVSYTVSKTGYDTETNTVTVTSDQTINVDLSVTYCTLTINPTPADATVVLTAPSINTLDTEGFSYFNSGNNNIILTTYTGSNTIVNVPTITSTSQVGNSITVPYGTVVNYTVSKQGYITESSTYTVTTTETIPVVLSLIEYTLTINPTPADALVVLTAAGFVQQGNAITVTPGTTVDYSVSKQGYVTQSGSYSIVDRNITVSINLVLEQYTITIDPTPNDAIVTLTAAGYTQVGNSITVPNGTNVDYSVSKTGYTTVSSSVTATADQTIPVTLTVAQFTYTIAPTPNDAVVVLTAGGFVQQGNSITVDYGTTVNYSVSKTGYVTQSGSHSVTADYTESINLVLEQYTITIDPTPIDATVTLTAQGYTQVGNSITVDNGTVVDYTVSKTGYNTVSSSVTATADQTIPVSLTVAQFTFTVAPTPNDATVTLTAQGYTQVGNSITVNYGTPVNYTVVKTGYVTQSGGQIITSDQTLSVSLSVAQFTFTVAPTPNDATVVLTAAGFVQQGNAITVDYGTSVDYTVSKTGYVSQSGSHSVIADYTETVSLVLEQHTLTIVPTPSDATVTLTAAGYTQVGNSITVPYGTSVDYTVSRNGYTPRSDTIVVNSTSSLNVNLSASQFTLTINPTPSDATVVLTASGFIQQGNSITVDSGTTVNYSVSKQGYVTHTNSAVVTADESRNVVLSLEQYTLTIVPTPSDATVVLSATGYTQVGNTITVDNGTVVTYTVSKQDYDTQTGSVTMTADQSLPINLSVTNCTLTINPTPADATVTLSATGYSQVGNSITVPVNTSVQYRVEKVGYDVVMNTIVVTTTDTINVVLSETMCTLVVNPTPADASVTLTAAGYAQSGNSITVPYGTSVDYTVSAPHYQTASNTVTVIASETLSVALLLQQYTLTINPTPADALVVLTATGFVQQGNTITVDYGTSVDYTVSKPDYVTQSNTVIVNDDQTLNINLSEVLYTLTIDPVPSDATVTLTATGYTQVGNSISAPAGTHVDILVEALGYQSYHNAVNISTTDTITVNLQLEDYTLTINPTPADATVVLTAAGYTQVGNSITVPNGTTVEYTVSKQDYITQTNTVVVSSNQTLDITLAVVQYTLTIEPSPVDALVELVAIGYTQVGNSITVNVGTSVTYTVSKQGYTTETDTVIVNSDTTLPVSIVANYCSFTISPTPADAIVKLNETVYPNNTISVLSGTTVSYEVSKTGYDTITGLFTVNTTYTLEITLHESVTGQIHIQHLRGSEAQNLAYVGREGEFTYAIDTHNVRIHDGTTPGGHLVGGGGGQATNIDHHTITNNASDEIQTVAVINQNEATGSEPYVYDWVGSLQEYNTQNIATTHPEWVCYITDDVSGGSSVYTTTEADNTFVRKNGNYIETITGQKLFNSGDSLSGKSQSTLELIDIDSSSDSFKEIAWVDNNDKLVANARGGIENNTRGLKLHTFNSLGSDKGGLDVVYNPNEDKVIATVDSKPSNISNGKDIVNTEWINNNRTNCLLNVPQTVKAEFNFNTKTLIVKSSSVVFKPNGMDGTDKDFTKIVLSRDYTLQYTATNDDTDICVCYDTVNDALIAVPMFTNTCAGATDTLGIADRLWYDTTNNVINYYANANSTPDITDITLPLCIVKAGTNGMDKIEQLFNGFGYIASTTFVLPGVTGLFADGLNLDGSYKNRVVTNEKVSIYETHGYSSYKTCSLFVNSTTSMILKLELDELNFIEGDTLSQPKDSSVYWYNTLENKVYNVSNYDTYNIVYAILNFGIVIRNSTENISKFNIVRNKSFDMLDKSDTKYISSQSFPSELYTDYTISTSPMNIEVKDDGWLNVVAENVSSGQYIKLEGRLVQCATSSNVTQTLTLCVQVSKGELVKFTYSTLQTDITKLRLVKANGSN